MDNYVDGVTFIHCANVEKYIKAGCLYDWAKKMQSGSSLSSTSKVSVREILAVEESFEQDFLHYVVYWL